MKYNEMIEVNKGFQASVNLEYDLDSTGKICGYIPTRSSVKVLGEFLHSYYYSSNTTGRATVLIGPYGRGKSHLLLVLSALTSLDLRATTDKDRLKARKIQYELCEKISRVNKEVGALAKTVVDSEIRTLPVIINSNSTDINQAFLLALGTALRNSNLQSLLPDTYFDSAIEIVNRWKTSFPDAYKKLAKELKTKKTTVDELVLELKQYSRNAYEIFCECYPLITAGAEFNPLANMDVVKLYLAVANALQEQTEYSGITIIFDEFSKFLEANLEKSKMLNFKIIQDMAEAATRSGKTQLHFTCITHKEILDYSSSDSFKTVEGRFRKLKFITSSEQSYELISNAIVKREQFEEFKQSHADEFDVLSTAAYSTGVFESISNEVYMQKVVYGCFPLTPLSAFALLNVSELVGQNERTLFTFLAQDSKDSLSSFLSNEADEFSAITIDYIYDYFKDLFKKEIFNVAVHNIWATADSALRRVSDDVQKKIIKAIAVIGIIGDDRLKAVPMHIKSSLMIDETIFRSAMKSLLQHRVIFQRDSLECVLLTPENVNVHKKVDDYADTELAKFSECTVIEKACEPGFVLPREYNDKYSMTRYFKIIYMEAAVFVQYKNANRLLEKYPYDGLIINIVSFDDDIKDEIIKKIQSFSKTPQIIICLAQQPIKHRVSLKKLEAVTQLLDKNREKGDPSFIEELESYGEALKKQIRKAVNSVYAPSAVGSFFMNCNGELPITKSTELNRTVSKICAECYNLTPVVNNEMVNKKNLNIQNIKARNLVTDWVLQHSDDTAIPCIEGSGPEASIFKSAFRQTGLDKSSISDDNGINEVLKTINDFIASCENSANSFSTLYQILYSAPIAMRKGVIPLYIAYALRQHKDSVILYFNGKEVELSASTLNHLNDSPEKYQMMVETGLDERNKYLDELQVLFEQNSDSNSQGVNRIYSIVKNMQSWLRSLPEYTKKYQYTFKGDEIVAIDKKTEFVRSSLMKFELNSRELLFEKFTTELSENANLQQCLKEIGRIKNELDAHLANCRNELKRKLTDIFMPGYGGGLTHAASSWYKNLPDATKHYVFNADKNSLLTIVATIKDYDDDRLLDELVASFVTIAVEDWNDSLANTFITTINEAVTGINEYNATKTEVKQSGKLSITLDGANIEKSFAAEDITPLGNTALNNLRAVFDEYNDALEPNEQLAILAKLIGEIIH